MPTTYSPIDMKLKPTVLPPKVLESIGRLVRAFAEIDDIISLWICRLAEIRVHKAIILLGRTQAGTKLDIATYLAKLEGGIILELHNLCFTKTLADCRRCRNAVAHGVLLGETEEGRLAFMTSDQLPPDPPYSVHQTIAYTVEGIEQAARYSEEHIKILTHNLKLSASREKRNLQPLRAHRKAQNPQQNKKKPPPPPQSSPA